MEVTQTVKGAEVGGGLQSPPPDFWGGVEDMTNHPNFDMILF